MIKALLNLDKKWVIVAGALFSLLNGVFIALEQFWGLAIPLILVLIVSIVLALDKVLLFLIFFTPLSLFFYDENLEIGFTVPTEPIMFALMILFFLRVLYQGTFDSKIVRHPVSLAILFNLGWMLLTTVSSEMPWVSFKALIARTWFLVVYFYLMSQVLKVNKNQSLFFWLYIIPLAIVVIYTVLNHARFDFTRDAGGWVMSPFYKEHTVYGAALAMYLPVTFIFAFFYPHHRNFRIIATVFFCILTVGIILSYTRAAWVSVVVAVVVAAMVVFKIRKWMLAGLAAIALAVFIWSYDDLMERFHSNENVSSTNLTEHVGSISNISSDVSNLERINRWKSALRMFEERPFLGFGPGTYMFQYAPYQKPQEMTIISTNSGNKGNAHSEYIGALAESGVFGGLSITLIVILTVVTGIRLYYRLDNKKHKLLALAALMGLITYWTHAFLNNFLDSDKAACPVWGFSALLVVLDCYFRPPSKI